ncbi:DUF7507 domain-containing protein, partial [Jannaschia pohangensis]
DPATLTVTYTAAPVAVNDSQDNLTVGDVATVPVTVNDSGNNGFPGGALDPDSVRLVDAGGAPVTQLVVPGEGTWDALPGGEIRFTPEPGFTGDPTPVTYTVADLNGSRSNPATVTLDYVAPPVAVDDSVGPLPRGDVATVPVVGNDTAGDNPVNVATVTLTDPAAVDTDTDGRPDTLVVPGEGTWTVTPTGDVTFTPDPALVGDPTPTTYVVEDTIGTLSNEGTISVTYEPPLPAINVEKVLIAPLAVAVGDTATFEVRATNTGNVRLENPVITDVMTNADGDPAPFDTLVRTDAGGPIDPGGVATWQVTRVLTQSDVDSGGLENSARVAATAIGSPAPVFDDSDDADDFDGNTVDDPTVLALPRNPSAVISKVAGAPTRVGATVFDVPFTISVTNDGNLTQTALVLTDDLAAWATPAVVTGVTAPVATGFGGTGGANVGFDGAGDTNLLTGDVTLAPGATGQVTFTVTVDVAAGSPPRPNIATLASAELVAPIQGTTSVALSAADVLSATKTVTPSQVLLGGTVQYTLAFTNGATALAGVALIDELPVGVAYTPGTALVDGVALEPVQSGRTLRWSGINVAAGATVTVTFSARVGEGTSERVNRTFALDPAGTPLSNVATATLRLRTEAAFTCGDVIGKVFDDRDLDGIQDEQSAALSDQAYVGGKPVVAPATLPGHEPGLAGVRLATVDGIIITTDEYGRFSVPCAALPLQGGSNFTLKLDERSLPTGYNLTTENPRTLRITRGTVTKMNFGATLVDVVGIDLTAEAFAGSAPSAALRDGLTGLRAQLAGAPVLLRLTYVRRGDSTETARARLDAVEALARDIWRGGGQVEVDRRIAN